MDERPFAVNLRRAEVADARLLADLRIASERERYPERGRDEALHAACVTFFVAEIGRADPFVRAWIAHAGAEVVGTASLTILPTLPRAGSERALDGRIRNVYVVPAYRRRGVATLLTRAAIDEAERAFVDRLTLGASVEGMAVYEKLGFVLKRDEMLYAPRR